MGDKLRQAVSDLLYKQKQYFAAEPSFENTAYEQLREARAKVEELMLVEEITLREVKGSVNDTNDVENG